MIQLRGYQLDAVAAVYRHLRERDDNPVVVIPTAGGKTPILATICRDAVTRWNGRVLVVSHVKELLQQAVDKLKLVCPELPVGVYSAGLNRRDTGQRVIVAGIQSIYKRAGELDAFDLIIVDEAHLIPTDGEGMYRQFLAEAKAINPLLRVIGLTASAVWPEGTHNAGVKARFRRGDSRCRLPAVYAAQIIPQPTPVLANCKQLTCRYFGPRFTGVSTAYYPAGVAIVTNYDGVSPAAELQSSAAEGRSRGGEDDSVHRGVSGRNHGGLWPGAVFRGPCDPG